MELFYSFASLLKKKKKLCSLAHTIVHDFHFKVPGNYDSTPETRPPQHFQPLGVF
jgi:hypothetical protein